MEERDFNIETMKGFHAGKEKTVLDRDLWITNDSFRFVGWPSDC